jgi:hypothetical protein
MDEVFARLDNEPKIGAKIKRATKQIGEQK